MLALLRPSLFLALGAPCLGSSHSQVPGDGPFLGFGLLGPGAILPWELSLAPPLCHGTHEIQTSNLASRTGCCDPR